MEFLSKKRTQYSDLPDEEARFIETANLQPWYKRRNVQLAIIATAIVLAIGVILAIAIPVALHDSDSDSHRTDSRPLFSFEDIFSTSAEGFSMQWWCPDADAPQVSPASFIYRDTGGNIVQQFVSNTTKSFPDEENQTVLFNKTGFVEAGNEWANSIGSFFVAPGSGSRIILATNVTYRWRHSYFANFYVYSISSKTAVPLDVQNRLLMNPVWSPTDDNNAAYVRDNNIFVKDLSTNTERQITSDGTPGRMSDGSSLVNGVQSWVYEEEVFSDMNAIWWAPDGAQLAYLKFNETQVPQFYMPVYDGNAYPEIVNLAYPKPGFPNPVVTVAVYDLASGNTTYLDWSNSGNYEYVTGVWWVDSATLAVRRLNRLQNEEQTLLFNVEDDSSTRVLFTKNSTAWIETQFELTFLREANGSVLYFVDLVANSKSYPQVALYDYSTGSFIRFLSDPGNSASWEVTSINQWLPSTRTLVYTSAEVSPLERHVYSQSIDDTDGTSKRKVSPTEGWWSATYSPCSEFYTLNFGGKGDFLTVPTISLHSSRYTDMHVDLLTNKKLKDKLSTFALPTKDFLSIPNADDESMSASIMYPPNFDRNKQYPVLMRVYGGPNSQEVSKAYPVGGQKTFDLYMASQGYIVGQADGRGTAARGEDWRHAVYLNLGYYETLDQLAAAKYFAGLRFVDASRIGIWGWSYGGYMSGFVGSAPENEKLVKVAMSVAPGTDWRFYDTVYTERYLRTPDVNPSGYTNSSLLNRAEGFKRVHYLLAHGTADDNVHLQHATELSKVLVQSGIDFTQMYYTNSDHSINNGNSRHHLYHLLSGFVRSKL